MERKTYSLTLAGRKLEITSTESAYHIERIRFMTEEEIEATMALDRRITFETAAAAAALRFAERVLMLEKECTRLRREKDELAELAKNSNTEKEYANKAASKAEEKDSGASNGKAKGKASENRAKDKENKSNAKLSK
jgi:hypothetical protein